MDMTKHFINVLDFDTETLLRFIARARQLKARKEAGVPDALMASKVLGMYFEKPSLRTRVSLEVAMASLGGHPICLDTHGKRLAEREAIADQARVMSRLVDVIAIRSFEHETIETMAKWSAVPVINTLSDYSHPTQVMADVMAMQEHFGELAGKHLTFVGDGNNVARSLAAICGRLEIAFTLCHPKGYGLGEPFLTRLAKECPKMSLEITDKPVEAVQNADAVYTDVWASMGQEEESQARNEAFASFQVNAALMAKAPKGALVMHDLPAHRGEEITDEVIDSETSIVFDQAENRMHIYRALFAELVE